MKCIRRGGSWGGVVGMARVFFKGRLVSRHTKIQNHQGAPQHTKHINILPWRWAQGSCRPQFPHVLAPLTVSRATGVSRVESNGVSATLNRSRNALRRVKCGSSRRPVSSPGCLHTVYPRSCPLGSVPGFATERPVFRHDRKTSPLRLIGQSKTITRFCLG